MELILSTNSSFNSFLGITGPVLAGFRLYSLSIWHSLLKLSVYRIGYVYKQAAFQNISCFVFQQSIVFHNAAVQHIYNVFYFKTSSMCIFNAVKKQSGIGFIQGPPSVLCLNKVSFFIMPLYKIYTMYSISKRRQCVFLKQSRSNQASDLYRVRHLLCV